MWIGESFYFEKNIPAIDNYLLIICLFHHDKIVDFVNIFKITAYY